MTAFRATANRPCRNLLADIPAGSNYYDHIFGTMVHKINEGGFCVLSRSDHLIMTTLGSCISVCIFDPEIGVGGMNHFLLPEDGNRHRDSDRSDRVCLRYGKAAMEKLVDEILKRGGRKDRLVLKAFGAGDVLAIKARIGTENQRFLRHYIAAEGMRLQSCDLGGDFPRQVVFYPATGRVRVRLLRRAVDQNISGR